MYYEYSFGLMRKQTLKTAQKSIWYARNFEGQKSPDPERQLVKDIYSKFFLGFGIML